MSSPNPAIPPIPAPTSDPASIPFCVLALKQAVDSLAGRLNPNDQAVTSKSFAQEVVNNSTTIVEQVPPTSVTTSWEAASFSVTSAASVYFCDPTGGAITATMPAAPNIGDTYEIKDATGKAAVNALTIAGGAYQIEGAASLVIRIAYGYARLIFTGSQWVQAR